MIKDGFSLDGKVILITGASSGIGRQCAINCSKVGATVALFGRNKERLNETLGLMHNKERHVVYINDLIEYDKVTNAVKDLVSQKGKINGMINSAGISTTLPLNALSPQKMEHYFNTNVIGPINLTRQVVKSGYVSEVGGSVVFISSVMGIVGEKGKILYAMTKGALIAAVKSMAIELADRNIRINSISPGVVETPMSDNAPYSRTEESRNRIEKLHPLGLGQPEDIANSCLFLLTDSARWITGTNLIVDGGYLAR